MEAKWWTLIVVCLAVFMLLVDVTIVNVALPSIQRALGSSFEDLQWVVDAYALALAALLLASGSLADLLGRKRVFVVGLVIFSTASLLCGLAGSPTMLNAARGLQGAGGAMMFATWRNPLIGVSGVRSSWLTWAIQPSLSSCRVLRSVSSRATTT